MSVRNATILLLALSTLFFLAGCGSSSNKGTPPPTGGFAASNFKGTYVFSTAGYDVNGDFLTVAGTLQPNGSLGINGGTVDIVSADFGASTNESISNSSYTLGADGRGQIFFTANTSAGATRFELAFVLSSNSHGLVTEFDGNGTGSGTIDLQTAPSQSQLAGNYTFSISGTGAGSNATFYATVGSVTLGASGGVTAGFQDINNGGGTNVYPNLAVSTSSFVTVGSGTAPGSAQLATTVGSTSVTYSYDVYAIDSTHLKLIETDGQLVTVGDLFTQATSLPVSATLTYTMSGGDASGGPLAVGGFIPLDGNSNVTTGGLEDVNDAGSVGQATNFGGGFSTLTSGRSVLTLTSFENGATNDVLGTYTFAAYPFTSNGVTGVELLEIDGGITTGAAYQQTGTAFAASQGYGFNLSAIDLGSGSGEFEEDDIAEFTTTSSAFTGLADVNDQGQTSPAQTIKGGSYSAGGAGRYTVTTSNFVNFNLYAVNDSTFLMLETDVGQIGTGVVEIQNATAAPGGEPGIARAMSRPGAPAALRRK